MIIQRAIRFIELTPYFWVLSTAFVINRGLTNGVVTGKYFWFYLSMGVLAVSSIIAVARNSKVIRFNGFDGLILVFGLITLAVSYWINGSEAVTAHVLLTLLIVLYFYFRITFQTNQSARFWLPVFLMITGLVEAV